MVSREYSCLFARNSDKKNKTWRDGVISVHATHRFARVALYEINGHNDTVDSPIDAFDLFHRDYDNLTGEIITSPRFIIKISGVDTNFRRKTGARNPPALEGVGSLIPAKRISRAPVLGTCRAFKKYCAQQDTKAKSLQTLPVALRSCHRGSDDLHNIANTGRCTEITTITSRNAYRAANQSAMGVTFTHSSSEAVHESLSPYSSKKIADTMPLSLSLQDAETKTPPSHVTSPKPTSARTFSVKKPRIPLNLPTIKALKVKCAAEKQLCRAGADFENGSPTEGCYDFQNVPSRERVVVSLGDEMMVSLLQTADEALGPHKNFDEVPIVDAELIGCIESALDHLGNLQTGL
ncbi:hypothetical protein, conserved [Babesia bigemina]|uniref:5'-3' DNA helicase ZGRF1-like N-terminal domain-containing protein n=1 Tax=Babesia bigemina TaxID=5866 RepID=A0A061DC68_BABBI|nr:hypothetical protein, conserved [Babesia bigemina]CDR95365.1 hypothetical protein, conserved [Babesia bigemina]|eukprot:XP_012767551.1 hypothetical protein, conserved [Babesia bigemina]